MSEYERQQVRIKQIQAEHDESCAVCLHTVEGPCSMAVLLNELLLMRGRLRQMEAISDSQVRYMDRSDRERYALNAKVADFSVRLAALSEEVLAIVSSQKSPSQIELIVEFDPDSANAK